MNAVGSVLFTPEWDQRKFLNYARDESTKKSLFSICFSVRSRYADKQKIFYFLQIWFAPSNISSDKSQQYKS